MRVESQVPIQSPKRLDLGSVGDKNAVKTEFQATLYSNVIARDYTLGGELGGRLKRETQTIGGNNYVVNYAYDAANRQTGVTYPNGDAVARTFTDRNKLASVSLNAANVATFNYDNGMRRTGTTFGNGVVENRTYFGDNLNNSIKSDEGITKVTDFAYSWDANKRKTAEADGVVPPMNGQTFGYDDEDRLTSFARNNCDTQSWDLSLVGDWNSSTKNGILETREHNDAHEILKVNATLVNHDDKGNLEDNPNGQEYTWDIENRLFSAVVPTGSTVGVVGTHTYAYDALGRRVSKTVGTATTIFVNDGLQEIAEYDGTTLLRSYIFGSYIDEPLVMVAGGQSYYYHANQIYSVSALTNAAGTVVERYTYDPYGKVQVRTAAGALKTDPNNSEFGNPWTFTGRRLDGETALMYYRARMYSVELGRFVGRDPWRNYEDQPSSADGYQDSLSLYSYVKCSPVTHIDPLGMEMKSRAFGGNIYNKTKATTITFSADGEHFEIFKGDRPRKHITTRSYNLNPNDIPTYSVVGTTGSYFNEKQREIQFGAAQILMKALSGDMILPRGDGFQTFFTLPSGQNAQQQVQDPDSIDTPVFSDSTCKTALTLPFWIHDSEYEVLDCPCGVGIYVNRTHRGGTIGIMVNRGRKMPIKNHFSVRNLMIFFTVFIVIASSIFFSNRRAYDCPKCHGYWDRNKYAKESRVDINQVSEKCTFCDGSNKCSFWDILFD